jgi:hypothetical protein
MTPGEILYWEPVRVGIDDLERKDHSFFIQLNGISGHVEVSFATPLS